MSRSLKEFAQRVHGLRDFITEEVQRTMIENSDVIEEIQRKRLSQGKNIEDRTIQKGYSPGYAKTRKSKGLQTNYVDLNFTGEFYQSLDMVEEGSFGKFDIISDVDYAKYIYGRFPSIMGLTKNEAEEVKKILLKGLKEKIIKYLTE